VQDLRVLDSLRDLVTGEFLIAPFERAFWRDGGP
jgi:hypothetical protein